MTASGQRPRSRLSIEIEPELRRRIEIAASGRDISVREFVVAAVRRAVAAAERDGRTADDAEWVRLSARSFARDWQSEEDRVYDDIP